MARNKFTSPTLTVQITAGQHEKARQSSSGGCLIADAIKTQYPNLTGVNVDMATIRATDRKLGVRYTYLCPPSAQHLLLSYDQGWPQPTEQIIVRRAVKIAPVTRSPKHQEISEATRVARLAELEEKSASGVNLSGREKSSLTQLRKPKKTVIRPSTEGPVEVKIHGNHDTVIYGGRGLPRGGANPNLLSGRDRHFGAKLANPGQVFSDAVEAEVALRLASPKTN